MARIAETLGGARRQQPVEAAPFALAYEAVIASTPGDAEELVSVTVDGIDEGEHVFDEAPWTPRGGAVQEIPEVGNRALVVFSDDGRPWVIAWWPVEVV